MEYLIAGSLSGLARFPTLRPTPYVSTARWTEWSEECRLQARVPPSLTGQHSP